MADIFDQISIEETRPTGDVFDQVSQEPVGDIFDRIEIAEDEETGSYAKQLLGSFVKGGMRLGQAILQMPQHAVWLAAKVGGLPTELKPGDPLYERLQAITEKPTAGVKLAKAHEDMIQKHQRGMQRIIENHPEWEYDPPENFLDLLTSPRKLSLVIAESTPVFIGAGIMTASGRPDVGLAMMYASEGQEAYDQAIADKATEDEAQTAYHLYGSVASVIEFLQLKGIMQFGKGSIKAITAMATKKIAEKGLKAITKDAIKLAAKEAMEEIAQGTWQEIVAKIVYDKSIPGGLWDFIDRRAQEGLIGFTMGAIPGLGGVGAVAIRGRLTTGLVSEQLPKIDEAKTIIKESPDLTPEQKEVGLKYIGDIETKIVNEIVERFPGEINSQESLEKIGNQILEHLGIEEDVNWVFSKRKSATMYGQLYGSNKLIIYPGNTSEQVKKTIVHELGHIEKPAQKIYLSEKEKQEWRERGVTEEQINKVYKRRKIHHPEFKKWVEENVKQLSEEISRMEPIRREEAIGPIGERPNIPGIIAETHNETGGSTIDPRTGEPITSGFAVAVTKEFEKVLPTDKITEQDILEYQEEHADFLRENPDAVIGTWVDEGKTYLDISRVVPTQEEAFRIGKENKQKAIFDLSKFESIPVPEVIPPTEPPVVPEEKIYKGPAYRVETGTEIHPEAKTAADVIQYEQTELGNDLGVTPEKLKELEQRPATDIVWVTRRKIEAARYGIAREDIGEEPSAEDIKNVIDYAEIVKGGEIIADIGPDGVLVLKPEVVPEKPSAKLSRKKALALGHTLPGVLGWDDAQRRDFMQGLVGKSSMKDMTPIEYRTVVEALQSRIREAGLEYVPEELPIDELVETLERTKKVTEKPAIEELNRSKLYKLKRQMKSGLHAFVTGLERMERFFEGLDGHKEGEFTDTIWKPIQQADELSIENTNNEHTKFLDALEKQGIDTTLWLGKTEVIPGTKIELTPFQKIGVYTLSQNKNSKRQLTRGMGFAETDIVAISNSLTEQERNVANWLMEQYETQWPILQQAAAQAGIDLTTLKKEFRYAPIIRTDVELDAQEDFLSGLAEPFRQDSFSPEKGMLEERKKKAYGRIEIDAAVLYMHNAGRVQRFIQMAPVAKKIGRILNNRKFKEALNDRTYGQGNRLINSWMKDAVRGSITKNTSLLSKTVAIMRRNGILYAIGYNIPSSLRQTLSFSNAMAVDPRMLAHAPLNIAKASTPSGYRAMEDFVYSHSLLAKTRSYDRDLRQKWNQQNLRLKLRRKAPWSRKVMRWIRWMDRHTVVVAWKSLYDVGIQKFNDEQQAMAYADKWISRTQPMANAKDLPDFFRGGTLERLLTTFQNQINNNGNFYAYDIVGAKTTKQISWPVVGYRVMFSYILPAIMFGMIGRGGPPKSSKQVLIDLLTYPVAPLLLVGRWIDRMIRGWGQSGTIAEIAPEEFVKLGRAIGRWDIYNIIKRAATTIGALTGRIPAQAIRTTEGAIDYFTDKTADLRRFIYSEWALKQGEPEEEKVTLSRRR